VPCQVEEPAYSQRNRSFWPSGSGQCAPKAVTSVSVGNSTGLVPTSKEKEREAS
jgi:hypothetical protein